jgi:uncharacterized integral membrane protein
MEAQRPAGTPLPETRRERRSWRQWAIGIVAVLLIIFVAQNSQKVEVHFFFAKTQTPLIFALLVAVVLGALVGWLAPRLRHRHEKD